MVQLMKFIPLKVRLLQRATDPVILFPTLIVLFIVWFMHVINLFTESILENTVTSDINVTKTVFSTITKTADATATSFVITPTSTFDANDVDASFKFYINSTLNENQELINQDIFQRITPLIQSYIQNWNYSFVNVRSLLSNTEDEINQLKQDIVDNLNTQSKRLNDSINTFKESGLIVASSSAQTDALNNIYLDYSGINADFLKLSESLNASKAPDNLSLPNVSFTKFRFNISMQSDPIQSFISDINSELSKKQLQNNKQKRNTMTKREVKKPSSKFVNLTIIFLCIYPALAVGLMIIEWFSHRIRMQLTLSTIDQQLIQWTDTKNKLERYNIWKPMVLDLCESFQNSIGTKCFDLVQTMVRRIRHNPKDDRESTTESKISKLMWWFTNTCIMQWYLLLFILIIWSIVNTLLPNTDLSSTSSSMSNKRFEERSINARSLMGNFKELVDTCESFDSKINDIIESQIADFYTETINESLNKWNSQMSSIVSSLPSPISDYVPWENITNITKIEPVYLNISSLADTIWSPLNEIYNTSSRSTMVSLFRRDSARPNDFRLKSHVDRLFKNSVIVWACIHLTQMVLSIVT